MAAICPEPGCGRLTPGGRCGPHAAEQRASDNARRNSHPRRAVYDDSRWPVTRRRVLARDDYTCQVCGFRDPTGRRLVCAHTTPVLELIDADRNPFDEDECETQCLRCSGRLDGVRGSRR